MEQPNETLPRNAVLHVSGADNVRTNFGGTASLKFGIANNVQNWT